MLSTLVMTIIGPDRPGLVQLVATTLADHGGNWLESRMGHLGGQFAGIVRAEVATEKTGELVQALRALDEKGLRVIVHQDDAASEAGAGTTATLELVGQDRVGILRAVTGVLANHGVNVEELASERVSAPMGGGTLFQATIRVSVTDTAVLDLVRGDFEKIASDLMVDLQLHPGA
jgi:glycine cleavage system regulatory protein